MPTISLQYGSTAFSFEFDRDRFEVIAPPDERAQSEHHLIDSAPLEDLSRNKRVLVIVSDLTRPTGTREFLPGLLESLSAAKSVSFLFATGLHRALKHEDKVTIVGEDIVSRYPMLDHSPIENNVFVGATSRGNHVEIDAQVMDHDLIVLTGAIAFHYFAGFAGGRKSLLPGVASQRSIFFNHLLVLNQNGSGRSPDVRVARLEGNPVHEDMVEGVALVEKPLFVFNTILNRQKKVQKTYAGHWIHAHRAGCESYLLSHSVQIPEKRALAIVSAGGFPRDINVIQAHKAYEFAQHAVEPGGTIILLAECRESMGHSSFFPWFQYTDLERFELELRRNYQVYGQTAYSLLSKANRFNLILVSGLEPAVVEAMGLRPAPSLEDALGMAPDSRGYILPFGADALPVTG